MQIPCHLISTMMLRQSPAISAFEVANSMNSDLQDQMKESKCLPFDSNEDDCEDFEEFSSSSRSDNALNISDLRKETCTPPTSSSVSPSSSTLNVTETDDVKPKSLKVKPYYESTQDEYLQFIEPSPVAPPTYDTILPGGCPKFAVMDPINKPEELPEYSPAAYKIGMILRKLEWLSPYEPSPSRSWKLLVVELNSTQLNFYQIPSHLENASLAFSPQRDRDDLHFLGPTEMENENFQSQFTTDFDVQYYKFCDQPGFLRNDDVPCHGEVEVESLSAILNTPTLMSAKALKTSKQKRLIRSYSLQHARIGLASDYTKKPNVLRVRVENEQILLHFTTTRELIEWNLALCVGRDVALDILERELPRYRTVPRRRRGNINSGTPLFQDVARRNRAQSDPSCSDGNNGGLRSKLFKIRNRLSSQGSLSGLRAISGAQKHAQQQQLQQVMQFRKMVRNSMSDTSIPGDTSSVPIQQELQQSLARMDGVRANSNATFTFAGIEDEEEENDERSNTIMTHLNLVSYEDDVDEDIQNLSDLQRSDDEDDYEIDVDEFLANEMSLSSHRRRTCPLTSVSGDYKWNPLKKSESQRKFMRNCIKCIKPLVFDEAWVNKLLVKATTISPLNLTYLRNIYNGYDSSISSSSSLSSLMGSSPDLPSYAHSGSGSFRRKSSAKENIFHLPDASLARIPNHNLKEYIVGSHGLIPKNI